MDLEKTVTTARAIAREAGALLRQGYEQTKEIDRKSTEVDLVTQYDTDAEALIAGRVRDAFPDHRLLAEEGGQHNETGGAYAWYVDPLDGTNNFAHGFPVFCVSMALYEGPRPGLGVIYDPLRDECFYGVSGRGAFLVRGDGEPQPLAVSRAERLVDGLLASGFPYDRHDSDHDNVAPFGAFLKRALGLRRTGSAALDLAYVAAGRLDGYWEYKLNAWDVAAGILLVQEAGGRVTAMDGGPFRISTVPAGVDLVASNGTIHDAMLAVLADGVAPGT